jgi:formamidopyrimidine-DNA glycosylase
MPELPEVEVARANLARWALGRRITAVEAEPTRVLRPGRPSSLAALVGARLAAVDRTGKALMLRLDGKRGTIGVYSHLGMTGKWLRRRGGEAARFSRVRLALDDGWVLHHADLRLFGRFLLVPGARFERLPEVARLGPDPLRDGVDVEALAAALARTRRPIKVALLDQAILAGVGNIQASEALFRARLDPRRPAADLSRPEVRRLSAGVLASIRDTLEAFRQDGALDDRAVVAYVEEGARNPFAVYDREGEPCPRCKRARVARVTLGGRGTFFCPREQGEAG